MTKFDEFYSSHAGKAWDKYGKESTVSVPQVVEPFAGQCVSLIKTYLYWLFGDRVKASYGNAIDYWTGRNGSGILDLCEVVTDPKDGDICISQADPTFGHIFIYKGGQAFTQNCCSNPKATLYPLSWNGPILGILRPKELEAKEDFKPIQDGGKNALYRLYNHHNGDHVYTLSLAEANKLKKAGWSYEGIAWTVPDSGSEVHRLYHDGKHHYTMDKTEIESLLRFGWKDEGIAFHSSGSKPIYRLYNPNSSAHILSASRKEHDALTKAGWHCEGQDLKW